MTSLKSLVNTHKEFLNSFKAPKNIISSNPQIPRLYGLPKLHKLDIPIRPVLSYSNTPCDVLSSFMLKLITNITHFKSKNGIVNTLDLVNKLKTVKIDDNTLMVSFDVCNLFTSVPKSECILLVADLLSSSGINANSVENIQKFLKFCLSQDFFVFNGKFYQQPDGLAMGNCLSPFLSDIFMDNFENKIFSQNNEIKYWFRYVDDCLVFINGDYNIANNVLQKINKLHPNISFTIEIEENSVLNFLDLSINRSDNNFNFNIYRKPTQTDHAIHIESHHPYTHKMAAFNCYVHRLLSIPLSKDNFNKEVNVIKQIATNNGYDYIIIDN